MQGKSKQIWSVRCGRSSRRVGIRGAFDVGKRGGRLGIEVCVGVRDARIGDHLAST